MSYTKGAPDDEALHKAHCARVQKGMEWGKEEERESAKVELTVIASDIQLKGGKKGRIIRVKADAPGKIGNKVRVYAVVGLALSAPALTPAILKASKVYLFLLPPSKSSKREQIVGCVIAQRISTAMAIATPAECLEASNIDVPTASLVAVDTSTGVFCRPEPLPTALGIPRLFVPSSHRRLGIASSLLTAAAQTFIHGCKLDPAKGEVAFTQPTGDGNALMKSWGKGGVRIYEE